MATALALAAFLLVLVLLIGCSGSRQRGPPRAKLCAGPHNIELYDSPYEHYPRYEGRGATWWDGDRRCMASCGQSPCTIWCR